MGHACALRDHLTVRVCLTIMSGIQEKSSIERLPEKGKFSSFIQPMNRRPEVGLSDSLREYDRAKMQGFVIVLFLFIALKTSQLW